MRSDLLSKRLFYAGCFGLPWLWIVHVLYYWNNNNNPTANDEATATTGNANNNNDNDAILENRQQQQQEEGGGSIMDNSTTTTPTITNNQRRRRTNNHDENDENYIINPDDHFHDEPTDMSPEEIHMIAMKWVQRCKKCSIIVVLGWIAWITIAQVLRDQLPVQLYILSPESELLTGW